MAEQILSTPEANQLLQQYAGQFDSTQDALETLALLVDRYSKISTTNANMQNKAVTAANKAMIDRLKIQADLHKSLTKHIADLNSSDATVKAAALRSIASQASTITRTLSDLEERESINTHPWYERARAEAVATTGGVKGPAFWNNLIASVTETGAISKTGLNSTWLVANLNSKIDNGEISDWRKVEGVPEETKARLAQLWTTAEASMKSRGLVKEMVTDLGNSVYGNADLAAQQSEANVLAAAKKYGPALSTITSNILAGENGDDIALEAQKLVDQATSSQSQEVQLAFGDMLLDMFAKTTAGASKQSGMFPFSVEKTAAWKGALVTDPVFLAWAEENGYESIGKPMRDEKGNIIGIVPGADDTRAIKAFGRATLHAGNPERSGYGEKAVQILEKPGATGIRYGTARDAEGNEIPIVQVTVNGKTSMFQGVQSTLGSASPTKDASFSEKFNVKDFIPVRMSDLAEGTLSFKDEAPTYYKEVQGLSPALVARKFYNEFNAGLPSVNEEIKEPEIPVMPDLPRIQIGSVKVGESEVPAVSVTHNGTTSYYYTPADAESYQQFNGASDRFTANTKLGTFTINPEKMPSSVGEVPFFVIGHLQTNTEGMFANYADVKKEYDDKAATIKAEHQKKVDAAKPQSLTKFDPTEEQLTTSDEPVIGVDYGINPLTGKRNIKTKDGTFVEVEGSLVKPLNPEEKGPSADDRLQFRRAEKEAKRAGVITPPEDVKDGLKPKRIDNIPERPALPDESQVNALGDKPNKVTPIVDENGKDVSREFFAALGNLEKRLINPKELDDTTRKALMSTYEALLPRALAAGYEKSYARGSTELAGIYQGIATIGAKPPASRTSAEEEELKTLINKQLTMISSKGASTPADITPSPMTRPGQTAEVNVSQAENYRRQAAAASPDSSTGPSTATNPMVQTRTIAPVKANVDQSYLTKEGLPSPTPTPAPSTTTNEEPKKGKLRQILSNLSPKRVRQTSTPTEVNKLPVI